MLNGSSNLIDQFDRSSSCENLGRSPYDQDPLVDVLRALSQSMLLSLMAIEGGVRFWVIIRWDIAVDHRQLRRRDLAELQGALLTG